MNEPQDQDTSGPESPHLQDPFIQMDEQALLEWRSFYYCSSCGVVGKTWGIKNPLCLWACNQASCDTGDIALLEAAKRVSLQFRKNSVLNHLKLEPRPKEEAMEFMTQELALSQEEAESIWRMHIICQDVKDACQDIPDMPFEPD